MGCNLLNKVFCFRSGYPRGKPHGITPDRTRLENEPDAKTQPRSNQNLDIIEIFDYF